MVTEAAPATPAVAGVAAVGRGGPAAARQPAGAHDGYECARAWSALTAAHARVSAELSSALARECGLTINDFEILLRLDRAPEIGRAHV